MVGQEHLTTGHTCFGFAAEVEHDLEELAGMDALVKRPREVGRQRASEELDLFVPVGGAGLSRRFAFGL